MWFQKQELMSIQQKKKKKKKEEDYYSSIMADT